MAARLSDVSTRSGLHGACPGRPAQPRDTRVSRQKAYTGRLHLLGAEGRCGMLAPLRIKERLIGDTNLLELSGHLVFDDGDQILRERIHALVDAGSRRILLDLRDVSYIDSGGIGAVVEMYMHLTKVGGRL